MKRSMRPHNAMGNLMGPHRHKRPNFKPQALRGIVLDTNAFKGTGLDLKFLERWGEYAGALGVKVWLPEPVLWELVSHVADAAGDVVSVHTETRNKLERAGLTAGVIPYSSRIEVADSLLKNLKLPKDVELVPCHDVADIALRDQILELPPGEKKTGVRTGASDSAWLRAIDLKAQGDSDRYVIVSKDRDDVLKAFKAWKKQVPAVFPDAGMLHRYLFPTDEAPRDEQIEFCKFLFEAVQQGSWGGSRDLGSIGNAAEFVDGVINPEGELQLTDQVIEDVSATGIAGLLAVQKDRLSGALIGSGFILAFMTISARSVERGKSVKEKRDLYDRALRVPLVAEMGKSGFKNIEVEGDITALGSSDAWSDETDALQEVVDSLTSIPFLDPFDSEKFIFADDNSFRLQSWYKATLPNKKEVSISMALRLGEGWELEVWVDKESVEIRCEYDASKWVGGTGGFHVEPPFELTAGGDTELIGAPYWAAGEFIVRKAFE